MMELATQTQNIKVIDSPQIDCQTWNAWVAQTPTFGLLQSFEWGALKEKLGWKAVRLAVQRDEKIVGLAQMLIKPFAYGLSSMAYIPRGPLVDWNDREATAALLHALNREARRHSAICLRIEPPLLNSPAHQALLREYHFQPVAFTNQPRCSMVVNLPAQLNDLLMAFPASTRANIRKSERLGVTMEPGTLADLPTFYRLMQTTSARDDFPIRPLDYYEHEYRAFNSIGRAQLFLAKYQGQTIAAQMPFYFGAHAATFHAGSRNEYRHLKAGYLMMWQAMSWTHAQGCRTFDLWGIPDQVGELIAQGQSIPENMTGGLWGVYYYKRAFRGDVVYYVGTYDYVYSPPAYTALNAVTTRLGSLDKLASLGDRLRAR